MEISPYLYHKRFANLANKSSAISADSQRVLQSLIVCEKKLPL